ncbi:MAG TPA: DR2241 family protein [Candidatus Limnocylindria bacterium]|nr:DR2241 family protein [Candidatus Limnocylindria bacterium]
MAARVAPELIFAQVLLRRIAEGFDLRHVTDREAASLRPVTLTELREIAQFADGKQFRPLKSAPTLRRGWHFVARDVAEMDAALSHLYPGAVADWFAAQQPNPPVTHYREFAARQTGMYRVTTLLTDVQVAQVARAGCHARFCLKQRLWTVEGLRPDTTAEKSLIACLEPCAVLMEFARTAVRIEQREKGSTLLAADEVETLGVGLGVAEAPDKEMREADFSSPENPRRAQLLLEKLRPSSATEGKS